MKKTFKLNKVIPGYDPSIHIDVPFNAEETINRLFDSDGKEIYDVSPVPDYGGQGGNSADIGDDLLSGEGAYDLIKLGHQLCKEGHEIDLEIVTNPRDPLIYNQEK